VKTALATLRWSMRVRSFPNSVSANARPSAMATGVRFLRFVTSPMAQTPAPWCGYRRPPRSRRVRQDGRQYPPGQAGGVGAAPRRIERGLGAQHGAVRAGQRVAEALRSSDRKATPAATTTPGRPTIGPARVRKSVSKPRRGPSREMPASPLHPGRQDAGEFHRDVAAADDQQGGGT